MSLFVFGAAAAVAVATLLVLWRAGWPASQRVLGAIAAFAVVWFCATWLQPGPEAVPEAGIAGQRAADESMHLQAPAVPPGFQRPNLAMLRGVRPAEVPADGFVGSDACQQCHPNNHASWHASYHRTMTQVATAEAVLGDFDDARFSAYGRGYLLQRHGDTCWATMHDPAIPVADNSVINVPVVMTTGSHHMQAYWYSIGAGRTLGLLPIVHVKETDEWIPRSAAFLQPEQHGIPGEVGKWNYMCSECHSTHRRERPRPGSASLWDTQVTELGISCEACHGPGQQHLVHQRAAQAGDAERAAAIADAIVNPADLSHVASSQVCGQCHAVQSTTEAEELYREQGHGFRAGDDLTKTHLIWERDSPEMKDFLAKGTLGMPAEEALNQVYYRDGVARVSGREYNGLKNSACHQRGTMSCLTCHQMHQDETDTRSVADWANDQLRTDALQDQACLSCHTADQYDSRHTHHAAASSGSRCYNCHMPHTTYGLLKAIRSHRISSPDIGKDLQARRPNACNLCHLDQTLEWSAEHLQQWYDIDAPELSVDQQQVAASVLSVLQGDAAERALVTWSYGWDEAQAASGTDWQMAYLAPLLDDDYAAIRYIARRSMQSLPEQGELEFDTLAAPAIRAAKVKRLLTQWQQNRRTPGTDQTRNQRLLINPAGLQRARVDRLLQGRDQTKVELAE